MNDGRDSSGHSARFAYAILPVVRQIFPDSEVNYNVDEMLQSLYSNIEKLPPINFRLCQKSKEVYRNFFEKSENLKVNEPDQAMRAVLAKIKRVAGEVALLLQMIDLGFNNVTLQQQNIEIDPKFIQLGINLSEIYLEQIKSIYSQHDNSKDALNPLFARIIALSQRKGWVNARDVKACDRQFKKSTPNEIRNIFESLVTLGYGVTEGKNTSLRWKFLEPLPSNVVDNVDKMLTDFNKVSTSQNPCISRDITTIVDNVDNVDTKTKLFQKENNDFSLKKDIKESVNIVNNSSFDGTQNLTGHGLEGDQKVSTIRQHCLHDQGKNEDSWHDEDNLKTPEPIPSNVVDGVNNFVNNFVNNSESVNNFEGEINNKDDLKRCKFSEPMPSNVVDKVDTDFENVNNFKPIDISEPVEGTAYILRESINGVTSYKKVVCFKVFKNGDANFEDRDDDHGIIQKSQVAWQNNLMLA